MTLRVISAYKKEWYDIYRTVIPVTESSEALAKNPICASIGPLFFLSQRSRFPSALSTQISALSLYEPRTHRHNPPLIPSHERPWNEICHRCNREQSGVPPWSERRRLWRSPSYLYRRKSLFMPLIRYSCHTSCTHHTRCPAGRRSTLFNLHFCCLSQPDCLSPCNTGLYRFRTLNLEYGPQLAQAGHSGKDP